MQVCTSLQTDNHASTPPLSFLQAGCPSWRPISSVKALKALQKKWHKKLKPRLVAFSVTFTRHCDVGYALKCTVLLHWLYFGIFRFCVCHNRFSSSIVFRLLLSRKFVWTVYDSDFGWSRSLNKLEARRSKLIETNVGDLQRWSRDWANIYVNYICSTFSCATLYKQQSTTTTTPVQWPVPAR